MKACAIIPAFDMDATDPRTQAYIELASAMVVKTLRQGGDHFHFVVDWRDPDTAIGSVYSEGVAEPHVTQLADVDALTSRVAQSVNPNGCLGTTIRSIATCRAVTFGFDGQAFLCLRHEDDAPVSPDPSLVRVNEDYDYLTQTDYFDGWIRTAVNGS
ncbi:hypothetical protein FHR20_000360 [Sphingomonas leidyi]|uniref:Uncharacterized protein n=2 Tax=Sphingomonas leidyi TaxID=68569 RepID=A0A7X5UW74_9SPHN|nr:hypothetical protein [Sphingomonas leidyi]